VLSIDDYLNWCSITENGVAYRPSERFEVGAVVSLEAAAVPGFAWGYWTGTDGANGSEDMNPSATVTMNASKSVFACCPSATDDCNGGTGEWVWAWACSDEWAAQQRGARHASCRSRETVLSMSRGLSVSKDES